MENEKMDGLRHASGTAESALHFQYQISSQLLEIHLTGLDDDEFFWKPAMRGLHLVNEAEGWRPDWPESEGYEIGPASIGWLSWHMIYWWSMVLDHSFGSGTLTREQIPCPASAEEAKKTIQQLEEKWEAELSQLSDDEFRATNRTCWPFSDKPFYELYAWLNVELMKNAAEIGYCRFLYAARYDKLQ